MKPENRDLFPEIVLFPTLEKVTRVAKFIGRSIRRMVGYLPEEAPDFMSEHTNNSGVIDLEARRRHNWQNPPQRPSHNRWDDMGNYHGPDGAA